MALTPVKQFSEDIKLLLREVLDEQDVWKTCLHCVSFNEQTELCSKCNPPTRPPARVIAFGCPMFCDSEGFTPMPAETTPTKAIVQPVVKKSFLGMIEDDIPF